MNESLLILVRNIFKSLVQGGGYYGTLAGSRNRYKHSDFSFWILVYISQVAIEPNYEKELLRTLDRKAEPKVAYLWRLTKATDDFFHVNKFKDA